MASTFRRAADRGRDRPERAAYDLRQTASVAPAGVTYRRIAELSRALSLNRRCMMMITLLHLSLSRL
jgi:hypothetical protein